MFLLLLNDKTGQLRAAEKFNTETDAFIIGWMWQEREKGNTYRII